MKTDNPIPVIDAMATALKVNIDINNSEISVVFRNETGKVLFHLRKPQVIALANELRLVANKLRN